MEGMIIRPATPLDAEALAAIYGHHVTHGFGTFEETPPSPQEMEARRSAVVALGLPYLAAEADGRVLGFAYASQFRTRAAYRYTLEDTVYVASDAIGQGVGKTVLGAVIEACAALGARQLVAMIGDNANAASIGLHRSLGFADAGVFRGLGHKHGRWVDVVMMQKALNGGDTGLPRGPGLPMT